MDLRHLRYFIAVAEELHFSRAAERIGIEQSPLSRAIRDLEADVGVRLLTRSSRHTQMTRAGEVFLEDARRIVGSVKQARVNAQAAAFGRAGQFHIGLSQSIAQPRLARLLAQSRLEEPGLEITVVDLSVPDQVREIRAGALDIGITAVPVNTDGLRSVPLWSTPLAALLPSPHRLATEKYLSLSRLLREPQVVSHPELLLILSEFAEPGESARKSRHSVSVGGPAMLLEMVAAGLGVGIALLTQVEMIRRLDVVVRPFERSAIQVSTYALVREDPRSEAPERFLARAHAIG